MDFLKRLGNKVEGDILYDQEKGPVGMIDYIPAAISSASR